MSRLDEIKARADAATEGPWVRDMHSPDMSGRSGWYIRGPRKLGLRSMVLNSRMLPGDAEFIEHAREDVPWLVERVRELIGAICWDTTCHNCSSLLDSNYDQYVRAEKAEAEVERLTAERDALIAVGKRQAARLARVEALAEEWDGDDSCDNRTCVPHRSADALRAALAGSEADTSGAQTTDPGCGCSTNPARARYADGDPAGCYCTCSDDAREGCEHEPDEPQPTDQDAMGAGQ